MYWTNWQGHEGGEAPRDIKLTQEKGGVGAEEIGVLDCR